MEYLAFALKYRPQSFDQVIGQDHVVTALKNAILAKRVHHAYLFSGPRGVGKTSLARILAKSLNCAKGPTPSPCGACPNCLDITKGRSLDIIEIDGASNRGIDEIRTLRENVKLSTASARYKVYIVDEVHMLTQEAFNALLKTLEEPPAHVKFIFATTHPHKVLPTILSRCQKFQFNLISLEEIVNKLKKIIASEKIKIDENLLYTVGRAAGGSIRDAESLLDQLVPVVLEKGSLEDVFSFLGIIDEESLNKAVESLVKKDLNSCLNFVEKIVDDGKDLGVFLNALVEHLRNLLLARVSVNNFKELSDVSPQSKDLLSKLSKEISTKDILNLIDLLIEAKTLSSRLNTVRIPLELALIKYAHQDSESFVVKKPTNNDKNLKKPPKKAPVEDIGLVDDLDKEIDAIGLDQKESKESSANKIGKKKDINVEILDEKKEDNLLIAPLKTKWKEIISYMQKTRAALASHLSFALPLSSKGNIVTIAFSDKDYFHKEIVEKGKNLLLIRDTISNMLGKAISVKLTVSNLVSRPKEVEQIIEDNEINHKEAMDTKSNKDALKEDGFLNDLLDTFGGKFHSEDR